MTSSKLFNLAFVLEAICLVAFAGVFFFGDNHQGGAGTMVAVALGFLYLVLIPVILVVLIKAERAGVREGKGTTLQQLRELRKKPDDV